MPTFTTAPLVDLGTKVVADINAAAPWTPSGGSALSFTARRTYFLPEYESTDHDLHVDILLAEDADEELDDRARTAKKAFVIDIGVQKVLTDRTDVAAADELVSFAHALRKFYPVRSEFTVSGSQRAVCIKREIPVPYSPGDLDQDGRFFSLVRLTFEGWYAQ